MKGGEFSRPSTRGQQQPTPHHHVCPFLWIQEWNNTMPTSKQQCASHHPPNQTNEMTRRTHGLLHLAQASAERAASSSRPTPSAQTAAQPLKSCAKLFQASLKSKRSQSIRQPNSSSKSWMGNHPSITPPPTT